MQPFTSSGARLRVAEGCQPEDSQPIHGLPIDGHPDRGMRCWVCTSRWTLAFRGPSTRSDLQQLMTATQDTYLSGAATSLPERAAVRVAREPQLDSCAHAGLTRPRWAFVRTATCDLLWIVTMRNGTVFHSVAHSEQLIVQQGSQTRNPAVQTQGWVSALGRILLDNQMGSAACTVPPPHQLLTQRLPEGAYYA